MNGLVAIAILIISAVLASVGISTLVSTGYTILGYAMLFIYGLPIITIGSYRVIQAAKHRKYTIDKEIEEEA